MEKIYTSADQLIGNTPLLELTHIEKEFGLKSKLYGKMELFNPAGSTKDRVARQMIEDAEAAGKLKPGTTIIEPTSGNTGIALAAVAATKGYRVIIVMPDTMSVERRRLMQAYGAELVLTDGALDVPGAIEKAQELHRQITPSYIPDQFANTSNPKAHETTTGPEIYRALNGRVHYFIAGIGTGGTLTGTGRYLKSRDPGTKIIAVEPAEAPLLTKGKTGPHRIQGIGDGFVPDVLDKSIYDEVADISDEDAVRIAGEFGKLEGLLVGISSGANIWAGIQIAKREEGKNIVALLADSGDRYLSTGIYGE
ncbi:MAG: cysteine synthase A [Anaerovoracaceae bacterium]|nr:cysteine synthase A [Anaerovoracaceae bacterium]